MSLGDQLIWLVVLALPVATIAWTVTHEEIARELRDWTERRRRRSGSWLLRKLLYVFSCEFCFSHYVTAIVLAITHYRLLYDDWRGFFVSFFALVAVANVYMSLFGRLRVDIKSERLDVEIKEQDTEHRPTRGAARDRERVG